MSNACPSVALAEAGPNLPCNHLNSEPKSPVGVTVIFSYLHSAAADRFISIRRSQATFKFFTPAAIQTDIILLKTI
jgi:hypothetical protein